MNFNYTVIKYSKVAMAYEDAAVVDCPKIGC